MKLNRLYDAGIFIIVGIFLTALGIGFLSVGVHKHQRSDEKKPASGVVIEFVHPEKDHEDKYIDSQMGPREVPVPSETSKKWWWPF